MIGSLLIVTGGLVLLAFGAERIVRSSDEIARRLGISPFFYALTVIALATSLPELVVNSAHAVRGSYSLVVDDVYRSLVFNLLAVLGLSATVRPLGVDERTVEILVPGMLLTFMILLPVILNLHISRLEGVFLLAWLVPIAVLLRVKQTQSAMFGTTSITTDSLQALLMIMHDGARFDPLTGAIRSLVDGGELQIVRRDELRRALAGWSDCAEEARLTSQSFTVLLAGLYPVFLGLDPGGPMRPGERFAVQYAALSSSWNSQLYELLGEVRRIIEMIENEASR